MTIKTSQFDHAGRKLEVRSIVADNEVKIRVFENGKEATTAIYTVTIETAFDANVSGFNLDLVAELMRRAEDDVTSGRVALKPAN